jgi:hypothetical protein
MRSAASVMPVGGQMAVALGLTKAKARPSLAVTKYALASAVQVTRYRVRGSVRSARTDESRAAMGRVVGSSSELKIRFTRPAD